MAAVDALGLDHRDALLAISASGRTPFAVAALRQAARARRADGRHGLQSRHAAARRADHAILLATPPEVIAGSTRMNAGTAQKCAMNMLSTLIGIRLGHGYDGLMVNVAADNEKLRGRAAGIVARAAGIPAGRGRAPARGGGRAISRRRS